VVSVFDKKKFQAVVHGMTVYGEVGGPIYFRFTLGSGHVHTIVVYCECGKRHSFPELGAIARAIFKEETMLTLVPAPVVVCDIDIAGFASARVAYQPVAP
jgi:hypothetical protein